ncbi:hypothetical protein ADUPG1_000240, partial [Aduncisulcus paluster]
MAWTVAEITRFKQIIEYNEHELIDWTNIALQMKKNEAECRALYASLFHPTPPMKTHFGKSRREKFQSKISGSSKGMTKGLPESLSKNGEKSPSRRHTSWTLNEIYMATFLHFRLGNKWKQYNDYSDVIARSPTQIKCKIFNLRQKKQFDNFTRKSLASIHKNGLDSTKCSIRDGLHAISGSSQKHGIIAEDSFIDEVKHAVAGLTTPSPPKCEVSQDSSSSDVRKESKVQSSPIDAKKEECRESSM